MALMKKYRKHYLYGIILFWIVFWYVWGVWGWNDAVLGSWWWKFDAVGHFLFGIGGAVTFLFLLRNSIKGQMFFISRFLLGFITLSAVVFASVIWEMLEAIKDIIEGGLPDYIRAQSTALDNVSDITAAFVGSLCALAIYMTYNVWYWKRHPDEEVNDLATSANRLYEEVEERVATRRHEFRSAMRRHFRDRLQRAREKILK